MNNKSTTHKAEGLRSGEKLKAETLKAEIQNGSVPQAADEQLVLDGMMHCLRSMKRSELPGVVNAAREWERIINFRIHMTMQERKRRAIARVLRLQISVAPSRGDASLPRATISLPIQGGSHASPGGDANGKLSASQADGRMKLSVSQARD